MLAGLAALAFAGSDKRRAPRKCRGVAESSGRECLRAQINVNFTESAWHSRRHRRDHRHRLARRNRLRAAHSVSGLRVPRCPKRPKRTGPGRPQVVPPRAYRLRKENGPWHMGMLNVTSPRYASWKPKPESCSAAWTSWIQSSQPGRRRLPAQAGRRFTSTGPRQQRRLAVLLPDRLRAGGVHRHIARKAGLRPGRRARRAVSAVRGQGCQGAVELGPGVDAELAEYLVQVVVDGALADVQAGGDLGVG